MKTIEKEERMKTDEPFSGSLRKEAYLKPETSQLTVVAGSMMLTYSPIGYTEEMADPDSPVLTNGRRGSWGNLWNDLKDDY